MYLLAGNQPDQFAIVRLSDDDADKIMAEYKAVSEAENIKETLL